MAGIAVASVIGGLLGGSALDVAGAAAAVTVPMAALTALRVLDHSADRTHPPILSVPDERAALVPPRSPNDAESVPAGPAGPVVASADGLPAGPTPAVGDGTPPAGAPGTPS
jgi:hypothetical protein